jgi:diaminohydroxyphosphoribosylaminopyrimidine deaminase/5-amino-6-(5-phosphoribosylamino)uracil reductase
MSLDGRIADARGASRWISNERSRGVVAELRAAADAVVVGVETVLADDPRLVGAGESARPGLRVVLDSRLRTPATARVAASAADTPTLLLTTSAADARRRRELETLGVEIEEVRGGADGRVDARAAFEILHRRGVRRVLLEAGGRLTSACLRAGLVRQCAVFVAPVVIGGAGPTPFEGDGWPLAAAPRLEEARVTAVGGDALLEGYWPD